MLFVDPRLTDLFSKEIPAIPLPDDRWSLGMPTAGGDRRVSKTMKGLYKGVLELLDGDSTIIWRVTGDVERRPSGGKLTQR